MASRIAARSTRRLTRRVTPASGSPASPRSARSNRASFSDSSAQPHRRGARPEHRQDRTDRANARHPPTRHPRASPANFLGFFRSDHRPRSTAPRDLAWSDRRRSWSAPLWGGKRAESGHATWLFFGTARRRIRSARRNRWWHREMRSPVTRRSFSRHLLVLRLDDNRIASAQHVPSRAAGSLAIRVGRVRWRRGRSSDPRSYYLLTLHSADGTAVGQDSPRAMRAGSLSLFGVSHHARAGPLANAVRASSCLQPGRSSWDRYGLRLRRDTVCKARILSRKLRTRVPRKAKLPKDTLGPSRAKAESTLRTEALSLP
jgi:hypothetical protein